MIKVKQKGNFDKTEKFFRHNRDKDYITYLKHCGEEGVAALSAATPIDSGLTAASWTYDIEKTKDGYSVVWKNLNVVNNENIALLLQYGHGTRNGGFVQGRDYINPALRPVFDAMAENVWKEVVAS